MYGRYGHMTPVKPEQKVTIKVTIDVSRKVSKSEQKGAKK
jgi:hypothetical protein